ncbi:hypothetical protein HGRIS_006601 [Hohenbuehelia grisea]|uniref:Alpha/beta hydrolase fold-3 domain-containing protein n=1 Tax=Hohenbuehelia grisea TaxID=104357 RepID=A0ABR3JAJ5_9AGAR
MVSASQYTINLAVLNEKVPIKGGGFAGPLSDFQIEYWYRIQQSLLEGHGRNLGVAVLQYSLIPKVFPTQLNQAILAVKHLLSIGVPTSNIYLAGDSTGGNLIVQLLSHILHPEVSLSEKWLVTKFAGACLVSPWLLDKAATSSEVHNDAFDLAPAKCLAMWRDAYVANIPDSKRVFVQPNDFAPANWFMGLDQVVNRILVTVGTHEVLLDSIQVFSETLSKSHGKVEVDTQENGVHCDFIFDVGAKSRKGSHPMDQKVVDWFAKCIADEDSEA